MEQPLYDRTDPSPDARGPAWSVHRNARCVVSTIESWALSHRNAAWEEERRTTLGNEGFERQYRRNWSTPSGAAYYPEFASNVREVNGRHEGWYVRPVRNVLRGAPFLRGWDFGYYRPAVVLAQWSREQGLLWVYREVRLEDMLIHDFRELVRFLCGQTTLEELRAEKRHAALAWIEREERERFYGVPLPWLQPGAEFIDFAAHHESRNTSALATSHEERTSAMVLAQKGIRIRGQKTSWDDRITIMRFLMREGAVAGLPRLLIDPSCRWLLRGLAGGLVRPTKGQRFGGPKRDRLFEDVHDALTYIPAGLGLLRKIPALERQAKMAAERARFGGAPAARRDTYTRPTEQVRQQGGNSWAGNSYAVR